MALGPETAGRIGAGAFLDGAQAASDEVVAFDFGIVRGVVQQR